LTLSVSGQLHPFRSGRMPCKIGVRATIPSYVVAHRWRYALPTEPLPDRYLFDGDLNIGACGDWCAGPRVEGAFLSGVALAERLLALDK